MSDFTNTWEDIIVNRVFRGVDPAAGWPASIYVCLFAAVVDAENATGLTEISGGGYSRLAITLAAPSNGVGASTATLTWTNSASTWNITKIGLCTSSVSMAAAGFIMFKDFVKTVANGDTLNIAAGALTAGVA